MSTPSQEKPPSMAGAAVGAGLGCVVGVVLGLRSSARPRP